VGTGRLLTKSSTQLHNSVTIGESESDVVEEAKLVVAEEVVVVVVDVVVLDSLSLESSLSTGLKTAFKPFKPPRRPVSGESSVSSVLSLFDACDWLELDP